MNAAAWTMMLATWAVISFFTFRYFLKVLRIPPRPEDEEDEQPPP